MVSYQNQCRNHQQYQCRQAREACQEIPEERRQTLREELVVRANLTGCSNPKALQAALDHLK